jgi:hypothetical protein
MYRDVARREKWRPPQRRGGLEKAIYAALRHFRPWSRADLEKQHAKVPGADGLPANVQHVPAVLLSSHATLSDLSLSRPAMLKIPACEKNVLSSLRATLTAEGSSRVFLPK